MRPAELERVARALVEGKVSSVVIHPDDWQDLQHLIEDQGAEAYPFGFVEVYVSSVRRNA